MTSQSVTPSAATSQPTRLTSAGGQSIKGRILTRHHVGNALHYYLKTLDGPVRVVINDSERVCFCRTQDVAQLLSPLAHQSVRTEALTLKTFDHQAVTALYCGNSQSFRQLVREATDLGIALHEADIRPEQRYLIERFIALDVEFVGEWVPNESIKTLIGHRARRTDIDVTLSIVSLDFECSMSGELYSVGLYGKDNEGEAIELVIMVGDGVNPPLDASSVTHIEWVDNEAALIIALINWFARFDPDIIIGWAVVTFDLALLYRRAALHQIPLKLGRHHQLLTWKVEGKFRPETLVLPGRVVLDGIDWLKAAFYQFDSYSLDNVSRQLLDEGKAIDNVANRGEEITVLFQTDKLGLAHYNITDSRLVWDIFQKTSLTEFALERSRLTGLEFGRVGASVAAFNNLYLPHLHRAGICRAK